MVSCFFIQEEWLSHSPYIYKRIGLQIHIYIYTDKIYS